VYFLALVQSVTNVLAAVRIVQIALGTAAVACVFTAARVWFGNRAAWMAALFAGLTGLFTFYETTILPSALDPFLTSAAVAALAMAIGTARRAKVWLALSALAFLLLLLNRPPIGRAGLQFYIGNNPASDGTYRPIAGIAAEDLLQQREDARRVAEASTGRQLDDAGVSAYFYTLGRSWISLHPRDAAAQFGRKLALAFNADHIAASYGLPFYAGEAGTLLPALFVGPWLLLPVGLAGLAIGMFHRRRGDYLIWASFVPLYAIAVSVFFVTERARLPLLVPLCIGAGGAADFFMARGKRPADLHTLVPRGLFVAGAVALVCVLALITNIPGGRDDGRAEDRTRMAEAMIVRDRIDLAEQWSGKALAIHPRPAEVHLRVGRRLVVHSRPEAAVAHLERALQLDPSSAEANYAMGQALVQARRPREAIPHLRAALKDGIGDPLAGYELARALAAAGDRAGALQTLQAVRVPAAADSATGSRVSSADAERWHAMGRLALQLESPSLAALFFSGAVEAAPRAAPPRQDLGLALSAQGRHAEAIVHLEQAVALDPANPETQLYLAAAYAGTGRREDARARAREALRLKPDFQRARQFLRGLK
jgi:tetratricopeptide (TPR) repeat protein